MGGRCWGGAEEEAREGRLVEAEAMRGVKAIKANVFVSRKAFVFNDSDDDEEVCTCSRADLVAKGGEDGKGSSIGCCDVDCLNYACCVECTPGRCPCGDDLCGNQRLQRRAYAAFRVIRTAGKVRLRREPPPRRDAPPNPPPPHPSFLPSCQQSRRPFTPG